MQLIPQEKSHGNIETTYTVTLRSYPEELPAKERIAAETRYAKELEKQLGGLAQVAAALDTMSIWKSPRPRWYCLGVSRCLSTGQDQCRGATVGVS